MKHPELIPRIPFDNERKNKIFKSVTPTKIEALTKDLRVLIDYVKQINKK